MATTSTLTFLHLFVEFKYFEVYEKSQLIYSYNVIVAIFSSSILSTVETYKQNYKGRASEVGTTS